MTHILHPDDTLIWADGTTATRSDVERGDYAHMSDDYHEATEEEIDAMNASLLDTYHCECMHR